MSLGIIAQGLWAYIRGLYLINCISCTAVQTNDTDCTQKGVFVKKTVPFTENCVCSFVCLDLCLCLSSYNESRKYCVRSGTDGVICFEVIGSSSGMNKAVQ